MSNDINMLLYFHIPHKCTTYMYTENVLGILRVRLSMMHKPQCVNRISCVCVNDIQCAIVLVPLA